MNAVQLLQQICTNRDLIIRNNAQAYDALQMLQNDYKYVKNDEVILSLELNNSLAEIHFKSNYERAIENSMRVVDRYRDSGFTALLARHIKTIGYSFAHLGEFDLAEKNLELAMSMLTPDEPDYVLLKADILHTLAMNEDIKDEGMDKAVQYLNQAIELLQGKDHDIMRANCLMGLGNIYNNVEQVEEALDNYRMAAVTFEHHYLLRNMAAVYSNIGNCYIKLKDFESAELYLKKSLDLRLKSGSPDDLSISYFNLAIVYKDKKEFDQASEYLEKAKCILETIGNKPFLKQVNMMIDELELIKTQLSH